MKTDVIAWRPEDLREEGRRQERKKAEKKAKKQVAIMIHDGLDIKQIHRYVADLSLEEIESIYKEMQKKK